MARALKRPKAEPRAELALPAPPPKQAPAKVPPPVLEQLQQQVDDIARRYDTPMPGGPMAPERVLDESAPPHEAFGQWLVGQISREDEVVYLAYGAKADPSFPRSASVEGVRDYLRRKGATWEAFEQLDIAEAAFTAVR